MKKILTSLDVASDITSGTNGLRWDIANGRFVIGTPGHTVTTPGIHTGGRGIFDGGLSFQYDSGASAYNLNFQYNSGSGGYLDIQSYISKPIVLNNQGNSVGVGKIPSLALFDVNGSIAGTRLLAGASTTGGSSLNIATGVAPTSPVAGDVYQDNTHEYHYIGGAWRQMDQQSGGTGLTSGQVQARTAGYANTTNF